MLLKTWNLFIHTSFFPFLRFPSILCRNLWFALFLACHYNIKLWMWPSVLRHSIHTQQELARLSLLQAERHVHKLHPSLLRIWIRASVLLTFILLSFRGYTWEFSISIYNLQDMEVSLSRKFPFSQLSRMSCAWSEDFLLCKWSYE
jgi:hypothetical protein